MQALGHVSYHLLSAGFNGYMATVTNLKNDVYKWRCGGAPFTVSSLQLYPLCLICSQWLLWTWHLSLTIRRFSVVLVGANYIFSVKDEILYLLSSFYIFLYRNIWPINLLTVMTVHEPSFLPWNIPACNLRSWEEQQIWNIRYSL